MRVLGPDIGEETRHARLGAQSQGGGWSSYGGDDWCDVVDSNGGRARGAAAIAIGHLHVDREAAVVGEGTGGRVGDRRGELKGAVVVAVEGVAQGVGGGRRGGG